MEPLKIQKMTAELKLGQEKVCDTCDNINAKYVILYDNRNDNNNELHAVMLFGSK